MSRVSVVVPTFNRKETLPRALESIQRQTYDDLETIVVDDGSTDGTRALISEQFQSITYIKHKENSGGSAARNTGIQAATGRYIAFLDSDDEWKPEKIERQVEYLQRRDEEWGAVYTGFEKVRNGKTEFVRSPSAAGDIYKRQLSRDFVGPTSTVLVRKRCFDAVGGFREDLPARQDYEMWLRISKEFEFGHVDDLLTILHTDSLHRISEATERRIEAHEMLIAEIKQEISALPKVKQNEIIALQYYTLARYCQKNGVNGLARKYFVKSLRLTPSKVRSWAGIVLTVLGVSTREPWFRKVSGLFGNND